jgi:hypothetical protein
MANRHSGHGGRRRAPSHGGFLEIPADAQFEPRSYECIGDFKLWRVAPCCRSSHSHGRTQGVGSRGGGNWGLKDSAGCWGHTDPECLGMEIRIRPLNLRFQALLAFTQLGNCGHARVSVQDGDIGEDVRAPCTWACGVSILTQSVCLFGPFFLLACVRPTPYPPQFREIRADTRRRVRGFYSAGWRRSAAAYGEAELLEELPAPLRAAVKREVGGKMRAELACLQARPALSHTHSAPFSHLPVNFKTSSAHALACNNII